MGIFGSLFGSSNMEARVERQSRTLAMCDDLPDDFYDDYDCDDYDYDDYDDYDDDYDYDDDCDCDFICSCDDDSDTGFDWGSYDDD